MNYPRDTLFHNFPTDQEFERSSRLERRNGLGNSITWRRRRHSALSAAGTPWAARSRSPPLPPDRRRRSPDQTSSTGRRRTCGNLLSSPYSSFGCWEITHLPIPNESFSSHSLYLYIYYKTILTELMIGMASEQYKEERWYIRGSRKKIGQADFPFLLSLVL